MKKILICALAISLLLLSACAKKENEQVEEIEIKVNENVVIPDIDKTSLDEKFGTTDIYIVKTYIESPANEIDSYINDGLLFTTKKHYLLSDSTWKTDEYSYKYKLELTGRLNNAAKDSTYVVLSNTDDITFDMAWKASGLSSNSEDYFKPEDAIIVAIG